MSAIEIPKVKAGHKGRKMDEHGLGVSYETILPGPGEDGGISIQTGVFNASEKTIKYVTFTFVPYNAVEDIVTCEKTGKTESQEKFTGPLEPKQYKKIEIKNVWYSPEITKVVVKEARVQYMDNTEETILGEDIVDTLDPASECQKKHKADQAAKEAEKYAKMTPQELAREERERKRKEAEEKQYEAGLKAAAWIKKLFGMK